MLLSDMAVEVVVAMAVGMARASWSWKRSVSRRNTVPTVTGHYPNHSNLKSV